MANLNNKTGMAEDQVTNKEKIKWKKSLKRQKNEIKEF